MISDPAVFLHENPSVKAEIPAAFVLSFLFARDNEMEIAHNRQESVKMVHEK